MAADQNSSFDQAERLLRQGKVSPALEELERIISGNPRDLLLLNRCGDLLARTGNPGPAIRYYERLADQFAQSGFVPKAIAIYKKALRLQAELPRVFTKLGELCMSQEHTGEARAYFLRAAEGHLSAQEFPEARKVYERLVESEPDDPRHRVRLAETRAAEGETDRAGAELVAVGDSLLESGQPADAEKAFERAGELLPDSFDAVAGRALSLAAQERLDDALAGLERASVEPPPSPQTLVGLIAAAYELGGRDADASRTLTESDGAEALDVFVRRLMKCGGERGGVDGAWVRIDEVLASRDDADQVFDLLERLGRIEEGGHLPALERLYARRADGDDQEETIRALEHLIRVLQAHSMNDEAERRLDELRKLSPKAAMLEAEPGTTAPKAPAAAKAPAAPVPAVTAPPEPEPAREAVVLPAGAELDQAEVPAVPLTPGDDEFVSGHLTEAEVLQKYGLATEALQRLRTVTGRFPGHVEAQSRLAALIRSQGEREELGGVLMELALAQRAAGETEAAREAAREAAERASLSDDQIGVLTKLGLLEGPAPVAATAGTARESVAAADAPAEPAPPVAPQVPSEPPAAAESAEAPTAPGGGEEVEILFGEGPAGAPGADESAPAPEPSARAEGQRVAPPDLVEEIAFYRDQGMLDEARGKLAALRTLGYSGAAMDELEAELGTPAPAATSAPDDTDVRLDESDLSDLAAALEAELPAGIEVEAETEAGEGPPGEESLEEVFDAFKRQVEDEVGSEDYRTHYDLGIAYKEMGLLDDALKEFEIAASSSELFREACSMLALCQRQRGELGEAVLWYQKALDAPGGTPEEVQGLRYDLADALVQQGDDKAALDLYRKILESDPGYRDVQSRVTEIQSRIGG
jgi:tetratricopeptide (TPR) repeat protein